MDCKVINSPVTNVSCDAVLVNVFSGVTTLFGIAKTVDELLGGIISQLISAGELKGRIGESTIIHTYGKIPAHKVIVIGLGEKQNLSLEVIRQAAGYGLKAARRVKARIITTSVINGEREKKSIEQVAQAFTEAFVMANYEFNQLKTNNSGENIFVEKVLFIESETEKVEQIRTGIDIGLIYGKAVNMAKDLVNAPGNYLTPTIFSDKAKVVADEYGLEISILTEDEIKKEKMNLMYSVGRGSDEPSKLIVLKYVKPGLERKTIALVGKGLTFDSGGISLKPSAGMHEMKDDMAGGAVVLGAMQAIAQLKPDCNVLGIIPAVENMPSGKATKPGDVFKGLGGKTVEVINTDAEGRLVLADAVAYAHKLGADTIVDIATLTGACLVALGKTYCAIVGNNQDLIDQLIQVGKDCGERIWQLPADEEYKQLIKGEIADLKNVGGKYGGTITAGLFIGEFVPDNTPWAHLDIAGTAWTDKDKSYLTKGGTGFGVRTLTNLVRLLK